MAKPRYSRIFLAVLFVSSCTYSPPNFRTVDLVVKQTVVVADDRQSAEFVISNPMKYDIVCANPQIRVVFDNPRSYLDVGEYVASLSGLYVEAESKKELAISTREVYGANRRSRFNTPHRFRMDRDVVGRVFAISAARHIPSLRNFEYPRQRRKKSAFPLRQESRTEGC